MNICSHKKMPGELSKETITSEPNSPAKIEDEVMVDSVNGKGVNGDESNTEESSSTDDDETETTKQPEEKKETVNGAETENKDENKDNTGAIFCREKYIVSVNENTT